MSNDIIIIYRYRRAEYKFTKPLFILCADAPPVMMCIPDVLSRFAAQIKDTMMRHEEQRETLVDVLRTGFMGLIPDTHHLRPKAIRMEF